MRLRWKRILQYMMYAVLGAPSKEYLHNLRPMIDRRNYRYLMFFSSFFAILMAVIATVSFFTPLRKLFPLYVAVSVSCVALSLITKFINRNGPRHRIILLSLYVMLVTAFIFGILTGFSGSPPNPSVSFNVLLVVMPLLICDYPWRIDLLLFIVFAIYLVTSFLYKPQHIFFFDLVNGLAFFAIGIATSTNNQITLFVDFNNRRIIKKQRDTDSLTEVLTKKAFENRIQAELKKQEPGAVLILDIDNFKRINDTLGHATGDFFIANTGHCLRSLCRENDLIGRFGGDEFVLYLPGITRRDDIMYRTTEIMEQLKAFFVQEKQYKLFSVSMGCALCPDHGTTYEELFKRTDKALYRAKNNGKNQCCLYEPEPAGNGENDEQQLP